MLFIAAKLLEPYEEQARERQGTRTDIKVNLPESEKQQARDEVAREAGIYGKSVQEIID